MKRKPPPQIQELSFSVFNTPSGWVGVLGSPAGLRRVTPSRPTAKNATDELGVEVNSSVMSTVLFRDITGRFQAYYSGDFVIFPDKIDYRGYPPFWSAVWETARKISYGTTQSYGWVARQMGNPGAARAVGQALGRNPFSIVVPCHRVTASNGLGGFTGGLKHKIMILTLEKAPGYRL